MYLFTFNKILTSGTKIALKNPALETQLVVRRVELAKAKGVVKATKITAKPPPKGRDHDKMKANPTCQSKRGLREQLQLMPKKLKVDPHNPKAAN